MIKYIFGPTGLVAGLILALAGSSWFSAAHTVGVILIICGGIGTAFVILMLFLIFAAAWHDVSNPVKYGRRYK